MRATASFPVERRSTSAFGPVVFGPDADHNIGAKSSTGRTSHALPELHELERSAWHSAGAALADVIARVYRPHSPRRVPHLRRRGALEKLVAQVRAGIHGGDAEWLLERVRLLQSAEQESRPVLASRFLLPWVEVGARQCLRIEFLVSAYLDRAGNQFAEASLVAFVDGFQSRGALQVSEVWSLRSVLQLALVDRLLASPSAAWPALFAAMQRVLETDWKTVFEWLSHVDRMLQLDPAGAYARMTAESRDLYRQVVAGLAERSPLNEVAIAGCAVRLAEAAAPAILRDPRPAAAGAQPGMHKKCGIVRSPAALRRRHVGYYLVDAGLAELRAMIDYSPRFGERLLRKLNSYPAAGYLAAIALLALSIIAVLVHFLPPGQALLASLLLLLPVLSASVECVNQAVHFILPPRVLPKLDFSSAIPDDCATLVAVPVLLFAPAQVRRLLRDLEKRYLANRDPNLAYALLTDPPDSNCQVDERDALSGLCARLVADLNRRYAAAGHAPFLLLHRGRGYNPAEGRWMGWERKRGKLIELNRLLRGQKTSFFVLAGDAARLRQIRYVITLDADTALPPGAACRLVGALAHPLNRAVVNPATRTVSHGYGILQPRIGIEFHSALRSRLAAIFSGPAGFDIYTRAVSDVYQDLFGEGIYTGKGIYDVDAFRATLEGRFPDNALLSHDLIEGLYARAALVSDIELVDEFPTHFNAWSRRKHRWLRGDWQILGWLRHRVPDGCGRLIPNPLAVISRWKILDNLRRSLLEPALLLFLLGAWLWLPSPAYWLAVGAALLLAPSALGVILGLIRCPRGPGAFVAALRAAALRLGRALLLVASSLALLCNQALLALDAIARTLYRLRHGRRLLEWETAAQAESRAGSRSPVDECLRWTPVAALLAALALLLARPAALLAAAPLLLCWFLAPLCVLWLDRPRPQPVYCLSPVQRRSLLDSAKRICRFFDRHGDANGFIPDSVHENGATDRRFSPTNLGLLLNARVAAVCLGQQTLPEFIAATRASLDGLNRLAKFRGHLFNWYDLDTLQPLAPRFVSTADSGNLAAALWTLKQACLAWAESAAAALGPAGRPALLRLAAECDQLVSAMDFSFLYSPRRRALSVGWDLERGENYAACYDLYASESRIAVFIALAKGDIPDEAWLYLGRARTHSAGQRVMLSWTGTLFEYLLPVLWMRHHPATLAGESARAAVALQRAEARRQSLPWGFSESACFHLSGSQPGYGPFGLPRLAMKRLQRELVVSPYSSFLALGVDAPGALENLNSMRQMGWFGEYGFYESADLRGGRALLIRSWMAHHQAMSLMAIANLLCGGPFQNFFHAEPQVAAAEILLHERLPEIAPAEEKPLDGDEDAADARHALLRWCWSFWEAVTSRLLWAVD